MAYAESIISDDKTKGPLIPGRMLAPLLRDLAMRSEARFAYLAAMEPDLPLSDLISDHVILAIPVERFTRLYGMSAILLAEAIGRETPVEFAARRGVIDMLVSALSSSTTLRDAVKRIVQFNAAIAQNGIGIELIQAEESDRLVVDLDSTIDNPPLSLTTVGLIFIINMLAWLAGARPDIVEIGLAYDEPTSPDPCLEALDIPVFFGRSATYLQFANDALDKAISRRPIMPDAMEHIAHDPLFSVRQRAPISSRVNALFLQYDVVEKPIPDRIATAEYLQISPATLHRRLKEEGTSFLALRSAWQQELAKHLLRNDALTVKEIALRTGFHSARTFRRAFLDLTGERPSEFRVLALL